VRSLTSVAAATAMLALLTPAPATATAAGHGGPTVARTSVTRPHVVKERLRRAIRRLQVARHSHAGSYNRVKDFGGWIEQGGGCDTRAVVLKAESLTKTTQNRYCTVKRGKWFSYYNHTTYTKASQLQIDHTVPVENAWVSGAWKWTKAARVRYYNDLGDFRTLVAVDTHDNEAKGDRDPTDWLPPNSTCRYLKYWTAVKTRWHLTVTRSEKHELHRLGTDCPNQLIRVRIASTTTPPPPPPAPLICRARMSDSTPAQYSYDRVIVKTGQPTASVRAVAHYKTTSTAKSGQSGSNAIASLQFYISGATPGYRVQVSVTVRKNGRTLTCGTAFTPHS
jgi:Protein of unknown function (DUF1524)